MSSDAISLRKDNNSWRRGLINGASFCLVALVAVYALYHAGGAGLVATLANLPASIALSAAVHLPQVLLTALAWRALIADRPRPSGLTMSQLRWFRESAGTLVPAGGLVGQVAATRLLARRGIPPNAAIATATIDITIETIAQVLFTLAGLALLLIWARPNSLTHVATFGAGLTAAAGIAIAAVTFMAGSNNPPPFLLRLANKLPARLRASLAGVRDAIRGLHADRRRLVWALSLHLTAWFLGAIEVVGVLDLVGTHVSAADGLIIESTAQALRTAGFMLPGAVGVQEGAIVGAALLVGIPAAPGLVFALVRRTREVLAALCGLFVWHWADRRW